MFDRYNIVRPHERGGRKVRRRENKALRSDGDDRLVGSRNMWLYGEENLPDKYAADFAALRSADLKTARAWAIKESLRQLWKQPSRAAGERWWKRWHGWAVRSRLDPVKKVAAMIERHLPNVLTYFSTASPTPAARPSTRSSRCSEASVRLPQLPQLPHRRPVPLRWSIPLSEPPVSRKSQYGADRWTHDRVSIDGHGRPIASTDGIAVTMYDYASDGKLTSVTLPSPETDGDFVTYSYGFDSIGRPTSIRRPDGPALTASGIDLTYSGTIHSKREVAGSSGGPEALTEMVHDSFGRVAV